MVCPISQPSPVSLSPGANLNFALAGVSSATTGLRSYSPEMGRWVNRDPLHEFGGIAIVGFVGNAPLDRYDTLGLWWGGWLPIIGPLLEMAFNPVGAHPTDYSYSMPAPCCEEDVIACHLDIQRQAFAYILSANSPSGLGLAMDGICVAGGLIVAPFPWNLVIAAACAGDGWLKAQAMITNAQKIAEGAVQARTMLCRCEDIPPVISLSATDGNGSLSTTECPTEGSGPCK